MTENEKWDVAVWRMAQNASSRTRGAPSCLQADPTSERTTAVSKLVLGAVVNWIDSSDLAERFVTSRHPGSVPVIGNGGWSGREQRVFQVFQGFGAVLCWSQNPLTSLWQQLHQQET